MGIGLHQVRYEVFGRGRDGIPVRRVKLVVRLHDLSEQLRVILVVEWWVATESAERERGRGREGKREVYTYKGRGRGREGGREREREREGEREAYTCTCLGSLV